MTLLHSIGVTLASSCCIACSAGMQSRSTTNDIRCPARGAQAALCQKRRLEHKLAHHHCLVAGSQLRSGGPALVRALLLQGRCVAREVAHTHTRTSATRTYRDTLWHETPRSRTLAPVSGSRARRRTMNRHASSTGVPGSTSSSSSTWCVRLASRRVCARSAVATRSVWPPSTNCNSTGTGPTSTSCEVHRQYNR